MTPITPDRGVVQQRLRLVRELLNDLEHYREFTGPDLSGDRDSRYIVERILTLLVEVAASLNSHLSSATSGSAPATYRESFTAAAEAGWFGSDLAAALAPSAGLRNILTHAYGDVDLELVARAIPLALEHYATWVTEIAQRIADR